MAEALKNLATKNQVEFALDKRWKERWNTKTSNIWFVLISLVKVTSAMMSHKII